MKNKIDLSMLENAGDNVMERLSDKTASSEETKKRIYEKVQRNLKTINESKEKSNSENYALEVSGVDVYKRNSIFRHAASAACVLLAAGVIGFSAYLNLNNNFNSENENLEITEICSENSVKQNISAAERNSSESMTDAQKNLTEQPSKEENFQEASEITEYIDADFSQDKSEVIDNNTENSIEDDLPYVPVEITQSNSDFPLTIDCDEKISLVIDTVGNEIHLDDETVIPEGACAVTFNLNEDYNIGALMMKLDIGNAEIICDSNGDTAFKIGNLLKESQLKYSVVKAVRNDKYAEIGMLTHTDQTYTRVTGTGTLFTIYLYSYDEISFVENEVFALITQESDIESESKYYRSPRIFGDWNYNHEIDIQDAQISSAFLTEKCDLFSTFEYKLKNKNADLHPYILNIWSNDRTLSFEKTSCIILEYLLYQKLDLQYPREKNCTIGFEN